MSIHLRIERLILEGLPVSASDGPSLAAALERELTRLLADGELPQHILSQRNVPTVEAGEVRIPAGSESANLGRQIAGALYRGISQ